MALDLLPVSIDWKTGTIITIISIIYVYFTWTYDYWKERNVPFEKPKYFFGNFKDVFFAKKNVGDLMVELYRKSAGSPYVGVFRFLTPALLVRDPNIIKTILFKDFQSFQTNICGINQSMHHPLQGSPTLNSGERWRKIRSLLAPTFMTAKMKPLMPLIQEAATEMLQYIQETRTNGTDTMEAKELVIKFTIDAIASCVFGISGQSFKDGNSEMWKWGGNFLEPDNKPSYWHIIAAVFPSLRKNQKIRLMKPEVMDYYRGVITEETHSRKNNDIVKQDYLHQLLQLKMRVEEAGNEYTDEDVTTHAVMFLAEGLETCSITLSFLLYELALNPDIQHKVRTELQGAMEKNDGLLNYDIVMGLPYLNMVFLETLRMHPPVPVLEKVCVRLCHLPAPPGETEPIVIDPGTLILLPAKALHHDPRYFNQPDVFDPLRFSETRRDSIPRFAYLPFGEGPRLCLGMRFAEMLVKTGAVSLALHYNLNKAPNSPDTIVQDSNRSFATAKGGLWLEFQKRN